MRFMILLWPLLTGSVCAQQAKPVTKPLYPYRDNAGLFGYADENLHIWIRPQYKTASLFTKQGFAVVTDSLNRKGVIDKNNSIIIPADYDEIRLFGLEDFTLAEVHKTYYSRLRFWEWKFLPGFNLMGGGNDNRLFDTKVKRLKKTAFALGQKKRKMRSTRTTASGYSSDYSDINSLDCNQVLIDGMLYDIGAKGARSIARNVKGPLTEHTFAQQKGKRLYILDRKGKRVAGSGYALLGSIEFKVEDVSFFTNLTQSSYRPVASAYENEDGHTYIYPDFSKPLPRLLHHNLQTGDVTAEEILRGVWTIASVPASDYFLFMSYRDGERFFWFLDRQGNWHQTLPPGIPFTVTLPSGDVLWPGKEHYVPPGQIPDQWEIRQINQLGESEHYNVTVQQGKTARQGIWDVDKKRWLVAPEYHQVYPMGEGDRQWRFQPEKDGLWGIIDNDGNVLVKPMYYSIASDGWIQQQENGKYISFYLHRPTLTEFREK